MNTFDITSAMLIVLSPAIGSFLAVLIDRLPRGEDVIRLPSTCRGCGTRLNPLNLIPILSFILQRGQCNRCGTKIPPWVLYVELLAIGAAVFGVIAGYPDNIHSILYSVFFWLLLALAVSDLLWFRLPDFLNASLALTAFALAALPGGNGWDAVWGAIIGFGAFFAIRFFYQILRGREGLGFGDVKLMIGLGAFIGPVMLSWLIFLAASATLAIALLRQANRNGGLTGSTQMPFGAALCAAAFAIWVSQLSSFN